MILCGIAYKWSISVTQTHTTVTNSPKLQYIYKYMIIKKNLKIQNALKNTILEIMWPNSTILFLCNKYMFHVMLTDSHLIILNLKNK